MDTDGQIVSLQVGQPQQRTSPLQDGREAQWVSAIAKAPVAGRVLLHKTQLQGDGQADRKNHGGPDKAVCCFASAHYPSWRARLTLDAAGFPFGAFGENWTWAGATEDAVCIGDVFAVGGAVVQISQPRGPCWKVGRLWERVEMPQEMVATGQTGWYLRVLQTGEVGAGDALTLQERPLPDWTVARVNYALYVDKENAALAAELGKLPLLAEAWRSPFRRRAGLIAYHARRA